MPFTSISFLLFFLAVLLLRGCFRGNNRQKWLLLLSSLGFYVSWSVPSVVFILFTSILD
jgi:Na+-driven multidrug efflux pump